MNKKEVFQVDGRKDFGIQGDAARLAEETRKEWKLLEEDRKKECLKYQSVFRRMFPEVALLKKGDNAVVGDDVIQSAEEVEKVKVELHQNDSRGFASVSATVPCEKKAYTMPTGMAAVHILFLQEKIDGLLKQYDNLAEQDIDHPEAKTLQSLEFLRRRGFRAVQLAKGGTWYGAYSLNFENLFLHICFHEEHNADTIFGMTELLRLLAKKMKRFYLRWDAFDDMLFLARVSSSSAYGQ